MACQWYIQPVCGSQVVFHCKQNGFCLRECTSDSHEVSHRKAIIFSLLSRHCRSHDAVGATAFCMQWQKKPHQISVTCQQHVFMASFGSPPWVILRAATVMACCTKQKKTSSNHIGSLLRWQPMLAVSKQTSKQQARVTWRQPSELLHLLILSSQAVLGHDSALLHNDDEDSMAAAAHLIQLGGTRGPLSSAPLHQPVHLSHGQPVSLAAQTLCQWLLRHCVNVNLCCWALRAMPHMQAVSVLGCIMALAHCSIQLNMHCLGRTTGGHTLYYAKML